MIKPGKTGSVPQRSKALLHWGTDPENPVTAVPVSILLLPPLWSAPKIVKQMAKEQIIVSSAESTKEVQVKVVE